MRPALIPAARRLWRDRETLQVGLGSRAVVIEGLDAQRRVVLPLLDGTRTHAEVVRSARSLGCEDVEALLGMLQDGGLLLDADLLRSGGTVDAVTTDASGGPAPVTREERQRLDPDLAALTLVHGGGATQALHQRRAARVIVQGRGRVGAPLAALLTHAGVGTVDLRGYLEEESADRPRRHHDPERAAVGPQGAGLPRGLKAQRQAAWATRRPALVALTDDGATETATWLLRDDQPHLVARVQGSVGVVGPLVLPGRSPCLGCLELVRTSVDPDWPALSAQLSRRPRAPEPCDSVLAAAVAAHACLQVLELLEGGRPGAIGGTLELETPGWRWRRRTWPQHPSCPCAWTSARPLTGAA